MASSRAVYRVHDGRTQRVDRDPVAVGAKPVDEPSVREPVVSGMAGHIVPTCADE